MTTIDRDVAKFYASCDQVEKGRFDCLRVPFESQPCKVVKARDIYRFYSNVLSFGLMLDMPKRRLFIDVLQSGQGKTVHRKGAQGLALDFAPIIAALQNSPPSFCGPEVVDRKDSRAVTEAALAIDALSYEGTGRSFGAFVYQAIIESDAGLCVLLREKSTNQIVGGVLGTYLKVRDCRILFFWILARKASYAHQRITEKLSSAFNHAGIAQQADIMALNVEAENKSGIAIYQNLGFWIRNTTFSAHTRSNTHLMFKNTDSPDASRYPTSKELDDALMQQTKQILGRLKTAAAALRFLSIRVASDLAYA